MKKLDLYITTLILSIVSCTNEQSLPEPVLPNPAGISAFVDYAEEEDAEIQIGSRSQMVPSTTTTGLDFKWNLNDEIHVYACEGKGTAKFPILRIDEANPGFAYFKNMGFGIEASKTYCAFSPASTALNPNNGNTSMVINYSYSGQRQTAITNYDHLGAYDYSVAKTDASDDGSLHFPFKHLGFFAHFLYTVPAGTYTELEVRASDDSYFQNIRTVDITDWNDDGTPVQKGITDDFNSSNPDVFKLAIGEKDSEGIEQGITYTEGAELNLYMVLPPVDLVGKKLIAILTNKEGEKFYATSTPSKPWVAGKVYNFRNRFVPAGKLNVNIKVNPDWQLGDTQPKTRAQGDPGYDKGVHAPKYLYPFLYLDGEVSNITPFETITTEPEDWSLNAEGVYVYKKEVSTTWTGTATAGRVYVIASDYPLSLSASDESTLKGLSYSIPNENSQEYMRNLYSTPLVTSDTDKIPFTGTVVGFNTNTPSADVTLYHVAAKVDVQWNSAAALPTTNSYVSVNNVKDTGLYYFKPTENTPASGSYTVQEAITPGTMYTGRQVFYLPQFADPTYSINIGDGTSTPNYSGNVTFTPSTTNGWTSWLKANIEIK